MSEFCIVDLYIPLGPVIKTKRPHLLIITNIQAVRVVITTKIKNYRNNIKASPTK